VRKQKGFSLIELLIVVAIILIIAAIAIPNLLRARISANESSAVGSVRTINTAEVSYNTAYPYVGFAGSLVHLGPYSGAPSDQAGGFIDNVLAAGNKSGYTFSLFASSTADNSTVTTPNYTYTISASPTSVNQTGVRYFFSDQSGVIRYNADGAADLNSKPLQ
jgi:prepilin-type N-terminal cleavage/methylation domain-containing protein